MKEWGENANHSSVHVELDLENRIYAKNEKQFIMKLVFRRSNCTASKLALKFWKIIKWLVRFEQHTADKVAALFGEGWIYNLLQQVHEQRAAAHYLQIWFTVQPVLICICVISRVKSTVRQTPVKKTGTCSYKLII